MDSFQGMVKRDIRERKFNGEFCTSGGSCNGCPFLKLNGMLNRICTLYRLIPIKSHEKYVRVAPCIDNAEPPVKRYYTVNHVCVIATSENEATCIYRKQNNEDITRIIEGAVIEYESLI